MLQWIILLYTTMLISSICLGTTLYIELNDLKMIQLFGSFRLILESILIRDCIYVSWWCLMLMFDADSWCCTSNTVIRWPHISILISIIENTPATWNGYSWDLCFWFLGLEVVALLVGVNMNDKLQYKFHIIQVVLLGTCQWILWMSCQQHQHGIYNQSKIYLISLYATTNQNEKSNFSYISYLYWMNEVSNILCRLKFNVGWIAVELFVESNIFIYCSWWVKIMW